MTDKPVFYFTRMLPAYRIPIMDRLNERLDGRLVVCFGQPPRSTSTLFGKTKGGFRQEPTRNFWFRGETLHAMHFQHVFDKYGPPSVVLAEENPRSLSLPLLLRHARKAGAGRALWGIFYSVYRPFSPRHPLQRYRLEMARSVEAIACYTRGVRDTLQPFIPDDRLFVAQNTMDTDTLFSLHDQLGTEGKQAVRRRLGLPVDNPTVVFTGQLIERKGTRELLDTIVRLQCTRPTTLIVIGDGPERGPMEERVRSESIPDVHFTGSIAPLESSAPYLFASDVMCIPGYVGLVVNHAFALGLPVVTREAPDDTPFHGPELESIVSGENGFVASRRGEVFQHAVETVLKTPDDFGKNASAYAHEHLTLDHMVDGLLGAIRKAEVDSGNK